eukprot:3624679-Pyramimonas_sp.AAC.1
MKAEKGGGGDPGGGGSGGSGPSRSRASGQKQCAACLTPASQLAGQMSFPLELPWAEQEQCVPCYRKWVPTRLYLSWSKYCELYKSDAEFHANADKALNIDRGQELIGFAPTEVSDAIQHAWKVAREGRLCSR